jgi:hypothetical protein
LGYTGGIKEILAHPFFQNLDIKKLENYEIEPPF